MIKIAIAGDYLPLNRVSELAKGHKFDEVMGETKTVLSVFDYRIVNLECPVCTSDAQGIEKTGPCFKCDTTAVELLSFAGFNCTTLANNHFFDFGQQGVEETLATLRQSDIDIVGGGHNLKEASKTLYKEIKGKTVAFINCAEHEFSIATEQSGGANPLNPVKQYQAIREACSSADYVVMIVHGGIEHYDHPSPRMQETYRFFIDAGADAVINHHQHHPNGYEVYHNKPIVYGLGNFCFDLPRFRNNRWNKGYVAVITLGDDGVGLQILPYVQCDTKPDVSFLKDQELESFLNIIDGLNKVITTSGALQREYDEFLERTIGKNASLITPYGKRWARALYEKNLLPSYYPKKKWIELLNNIECESHRERFVNFIKHKIRN